MTKKKDLNSNYQLNVTGLVCPLPLLKMKQLLKQARIGEVLFIKADDPVSERDFKSFIAMTKHKIVCEKHDQNFHYWITKLDNS